jgi:cyclopropane fatty-acyl-phospholipid synthase-like methyltransferase
VNGKRLLDLGCGDGAELLSWARLGASVVGVDNSPRQLTVAQQGADALGFGTDRCRLVLADLLQLPDDLLQEEFDVVVSVAVSSWIGDLDRWFAEVFRALKPGGVFLLAAAHSLSAFYRARQRGEADWQSYFDEGPFTERLGEDGAHHRWNPAGETLTTVQWMHTLGHLVTAVAQAGLRISHLVEIPDGAETYGVTGGPGELILRATK